MKIYRATEAAEILRTSPKSVLEALEKGEIKAYRDGKNWSILDKHLEEYAEKKAITDTERRKQCQNEKRP